jgi:hypothetical protein
VGSVGDSNRGRQKEKILSSRCIVKYFNLKILIKLEENLNLDRNLIVALLNEVKSNK